MKNSKWSEEKLMDSQAKSTGVSLRRGTYDSRAASVPAKVRTKLGASESEV